MTLVIVQEYPAPVAKITHIVLLWLIFLVEGTLIALSMTRIFLILEVSLRSKKGGLLTWMHSADRFQPA